VEELMEKQTAEQDSRFGWRREILWIDLSQARRGKGANLFLKFD
jgi:hypothetical protein